MVLKKKYVKIDWRTLTDGDIIKVVGGGSYWETKECTKVALSYRGIFKVKEIHNDCIVAYPQKAKEGGVCVIFMGEPFETDGLFKRPHKILKEEIKDVTIRSKKNTSRSKVTRKST